MREFITSERAQAMQVGFILIFGLLVLSLSLYQANIVPDQNRAAEITHSNEMQSEFLTLESNIFNTGMMGTPTAKTYPMSMTYQNRFITINPPPPPATLSTSSTNNIIISNSSVEHEVPTRYLEYDVDYRLYKNSPIYTYETGATYRNFDDAQTTITETQFILNNGFAIVSLQGEYNKTSYTTERISIQQIDDLVKYKIKDPEITIPTKLNEEYWENYVAKKSNLEMIYNEEDNTVTLSRNGEVELYLTGVSIGDSSDGGVNHNQLDLPESDRQTSPADPTDDNFQFNSISADRVNNNQIDYSFDVSAGDSDITQVEVQLQNTNGNRDTQVDIYDEESEEFNSRGFSVEDNFTGLGGPNNQYDVVFIAENENGDEITDTVSGL